MSVHRDEHLDLCAAHVLGSIDEADRLELERHLAAGCAECERALAELGEGVERLAASTPVVMPRSGLRARVLQRVRDEAAREGRVPPGEVAARAETGTAPARPNVVSMPRRSWPTWAFAAAAAILAVSTFLTWRSAERLRGELQGTRERLARTETELATEREWAAIASRPGVRVVDLAPLPGGVSPPQVRATYDPASRRAIVAFESLAPPAGSDFELWAILPDGPRSLGVVRPDAHGRAEVRVRDAGDPAALSAFAISLEREGGSPDPRKPAGPVVMLGAIKG